MLSHAVASVPELPLNWSAYGSQDMEGNIAGVRPGITTYTQYYAEDLGQDRYDYTTGYTEIYGYSTIDAATGCGTYFRWTDTKCCRKAMLEDDGTCSAFFQIQLTKKAEDLGAEAKGDHWQTSFNHFGIAQVEDWWVQDGSVLNAWYQNIIVGPDSDAPQWITVNVDFSD